MKFPRPKSGRGRPTLLNEEMHAKLIGLIRAGNYRETAAAACGITINTLRNWEKRGAVARRKAEKKGHKTPKKEKRYIDFLQAMEKAEAEAEAFGVALITKAAQKNWQAMAWRLERMHHEKFGRRMAAELSGPEGKPIQVVGTVAEAIEAAIAATPEIIVDSEDDEE